MDLAPEARDKTLEELREGTFRAMAFVDERRDNRDAQVSAPKSSEFADLVVEFQIARRQPG